jgi:hypothetical protein
MKSKEFTDKYSIGTKIHIDLEKYDLSSFYSAWPNGLYTYLGIESCRHKGCKSHCDGQLKLEDSDGKTLTECLVFTDKNVGLENDLPLGDLGIMEQLPDNLFEI